jgi:hypothetical protein
MVIKDIFEVGDIMEWEDKAKSIEPLNGTNCEIVSKVLNKNKIILHMKRTADGSEGNVFVKLIDGNKEYFPISKKLLASKKVVGMNLNQFKKLDVEEL